MAKKKGGRPRKEVDLELLGKLCAMQCTDLEICAVLDISHDTLLRRKKGKTSKGSFAYVYKNNKEKGKASLRRMQWQKAREGNTTLLIWLGKQLLGQKDKSALEHSGPDGKPIATTNDNIEINPDMDPCEAARRYARIVMGAG